MDRASVVVVAAAAVEGSSPDLASGNSFERTFVAVVAAFAVAAVVEQESNQVASYCSTYEDAEVHRFLVVAGTFAVVVSDEGDGVVVQGTFVAD